VHGGAEEACAGLRVINSLSPLPCGAAARATKLVRGGKVGGQRPDPLPVPVASRIFRKIEGHACFGRRVTGRAGVPVSPFLIPSARWTVVAAAGGRRQAGSAAM